MKKTTRLHIKNEKIGHELVAQARQLGASMAGITPVQSLGQCPSYTPAQTRILYSSTASVLVLALNHAETEPELDYWGGIGGTPGNKKMIELSRQLAENIQIEYGIECTLLDYQVKPNGIFLKDAAVLAGLGVIGRNNLLITPQYGPRVRLRAILLQAEIPAVYPQATTSPCLNCSLDCQKNCPQNAFSRGRYVRKLCQRQMKLDEAMPLDTSITGDKGYRIVYCRSCELSCVAASSQDQRLMVGTLF